MKLIIILVGLLTGCCNCPPPKQAWFKTGGSLTPWHEPAWGPVVTNTPICDGLQNSGK